MHLVVIRSNTVFLTHVYTVVKTVCVSQNKYGEELYCDNIREMILYFIVYFYNDINIIYCPFCNRKTYTLSTHL